MDFRAIERSVGHSPKSILDRPNISMLQKATRPELPELFLASILQKLVDNINVDGRLNLQPTQVTHLAEDLVDNFPVESLEDFVLCFRRALSGHYGTIYKVDSSVIFGWMAAYMEDKYMYVENEHQNAKVEGIKQDQINYEAFKERMKGKTKETTWVSTSSFDEFKRRIDGTYRPRLTPKQIAAIEEQEVKNKLDDEN